MANKCVSLFLALIVAPWSLAWAVPSQVIVIRHAEKPKEESCHNLSWRGKERSGALAFFFQVNPTVLEYGLPSAVFAFKSSQKSHRGMETLGPLAAALDLPLQVPFDSHHPQDLAQLILNDPDLDGKKVVICWVHQRIPELVSALRGPATPRYPGSRFDLVYKLTYTDPMKPTLVMGLQNLMQDDPKILPTSFLPFSCP